MMEKFKIFSTWKVQRLSRERKILSETISRNIVTSQGKDEILNIIFGATAKPTFYIFPFSSNSTPTTAYTYAVPVCTEWTGYDELIRQQLITAAASYNVISNAASPAEFTASGAATIYGGALVNVSTKGDVADVAGRMYLCTRFSTFETLAVSEVIAISVSIEFV
jgi:hypothetical protein